MAKGNVTINLVVTRRIDPEELYLVTEARLHDLLSGCAVVRWAQCTPHRRPLTKHIPEPEGQPIPVELPGYRIELPVREEAECNLTNT